jgi:hypothetical protein
MYYMDLRQKSFDYAYATAGGKKWWPRWFKAPRTSFVNWNMRIRSHERMKSIGRAILGKLLFL